MKQQIGEIRAFNRFYTRQIGLLNEHLKSSDYTLAESRLLYETARTGSTTAAELARAMEADPGYLSRLIFKLMDAGLLSVSPDPADRRQNRIALTPDGDAAFNRINAASDVAVAELLQTIDPARRAALVAAMQSIRSILGDSVEPATLILRSHRIGELGWLIHRQGLLYNQQYGWNIEFEALISRIYYEFEAAPAHPPKHLWIAERNGAVAGSVFAMPFEADQGTAQLRMLYVEPEARGQGIGRKLVEQCVLFAREHGYRRMRLWTHSVQQAARRVYAATGFKMARSERHHSFGQDLESEIWERDL